MIRSLCPSQAIRGRIVSVLNVAVNVSGLSLATAFSIGSQSSSPTQVIRGLCPALALQSRSNLRVFKSESPGSGLLRGWTHNNVQGADFRSCADRCLTAMGGQRIEIVRATRPRHDSLD